MSDNIRKQASHMSHFSIIRESPGDNSNSQQTLNHNSTMKKQQQPSELRFKIEPIGVQPEDDDDLETCPSRTRSSWPHQIVPWWKPADRFEKPPYSYATLIAHAILTSKDGRLTLSDIYKWISEAYPYYKRGQKGWQNSIRHNLSLNKKWFTKVDRRPTQAHPGKGGYWTLQVNMEKIFVDNLSQAGGHSRRHHDIGMYTSLSTPYYNSSSNSDSGEEVLNLDDRQTDMMTPNIFILGPKDFQAKKNRSTSTISAPRHRNMTSQEKKNLKSNNTEIATPKTDPRTFVIRINPLDPVNKRRKSTDPQRPLPKSGKRRNPVEPGSSTSEDDDGDSAVDVGSCKEPISKKRKSTTTTSTDTIAALPYALSYPNMLHDTRPSDVIGNIPSTGASDILDFSNFSNSLWSYNGPEYVSDTPEKMLLTSEYPLFDIEAQNLVNGLQSAVPIEQQPLAVQHPDMKTIDLQSFAIEKNVHYSSAFSIEDFSNPNNNMFIPDIESYNMDQFVDLNSSLVMGDMNPPSALLLEDDPTMDTFWPANCYMNFDANSATNNASSTMPFAIYE